MSKVSQPDATHHPAVLVLHGPNLNLLGTREPSVYGRVGLDELDGDLVARGRSLGVSVHTAQANGEGTLIDLVQSVQRAGHDGLIINPGGYTHTSVALADALRASPVPTVEVHLSNLYARESIRHVSLTGAACNGVLMGLGPSVYHLALRHLAGLLCPAPQE